MMNILGRLKQQFDRLRHGTRDEYDQTVAAGKVLMDILRGNKPTKEELHFLKSQSMDLLKILGLIGANAIPMSSIILVAIERAMKPYGISLLPTHHDIPKSLKEYRIFLDDERNVDDVYKDPSDFVTVRDLEQFKEVIYERGLPTFISFDHDLGSNKKGEVLKSGYDVAKWMINEMELDVRGVDFKVHSWNIQTRDQIGDLFRSWKKELDRREVRSEVRSIVMESLDATGGTREPFSMFVPLDILAINDIFREGGHELYLVGGCVRDAVMGKKPKDFDLATDALPDRVEQLLKDHGYRTLPTGKAFGIINVITDSDTYELATFRADIGGSDGRRPDSVEFADMRTDSQRRDLTVNALYYDISSKELVDMVGGLEDIRNGVIRTVGKAADRFQEDRLRIMRSMRFAARMGHDVDADIDATLRADSSMKGVSAERVRDEFLKGISSAKSVVHFLEMLGKYDLFKDVFPSASINSPIEERDPAVLIAWLLLENGVDKAGATLQSQKYTLNETKAVKFLIGLRKLSVQNAFVLKKAEANAAVSPEQIERFGQLIGLPNNMLRAFMEFRLTVTGASLPDVAPGPEMGVLIKAMETKNFEALM